MLRSFLAAALLLVPIAAGAAEVTVPHQGRTLTADLALAPGKAVKDGLLLVIHDELQAATSPQPKALSAALPKRGRNVLAITLSLGQDARRQPLTCDQPFGHKQSDASGEIKAWLDWAKVQGAEDVSILGFGRGGNQVAQYLTGTRDLLVTHVVLVSPTTWTAGRTGDDYKARFGADIGPLFRQAREKAKAGEGGFRMEGVGFLSCPKATVTADAFADHYLPSSAFDSPELVKRIKQPTLVVATPDAPPDLGNKMRGVRGEAILFEALAPEQLPERIDRFLAK